MPDLKKSICGNYCKYYKPGKQEELSCLGFIVAQRLADSGRHILPEKVSPRLSDKILKILNLKLCPHCPFFEKDCDFAGLLKENNLAAFDASRLPPPCGGLLFLGILLEKKTIAIDDISSLI